jgi:hypothetical protein
MPKAGYSDRIIHEGEEEVCRMLRIVAWLRRRARTMTGLPHALLRPPQAAHRP